MTSVMGGVGGELARCVMKSVRTLGHGLLRPASERVASLAVALSPGISPPFRGARSRLGRVAAALVGLLVISFALLTAVMAAPAEAHARLIGSNPADDELLDQLPEVVELSFDEGIEVNDESVRVIGPDGEEVQVGAPQATEGGTMVTAQLDPDLVADADAARGSYMVDWRMMSMDTHVISGAFVFHVGEKTGTADVERSHDLALVDETGLGGRWLGFVGSVTLVGAAALAASSPAGSAVRERLRWLGLVAAAVGVSGVALALVSRVAEIAGRDFFDAFGMLPEAIGDSRSGELLAWRWGLLVLAGLAVAVGGIWRRAPLTVVAIGIASFGMSSIAGHAWTVDERAVAVSADLAHFVAASVWIGGIVALLVAMPVAEDAGRLARRFSAVAFGAVVVLLPAGLALGWEHIGSLGDVTSTAYGRTLLAKASLFVVLVGLGWMNRARLVALVERSLVPLRRSLRAEASVAAVVLALTASLVNEPPPSTPSSAGETSEGAAGGATGGQPFSETVTGTLAGSDAGADPDADFVGELRLEVTPAAVGDNDLHLFFLDDSGEPLDVLVASAEVAQGDASARDVELDLIPPGHAMGSDVSLPSPGDWVVTITARVADVEESVEFKVEVPIT